VGEHLLGQRPAERHHVLLGGVGQHPRAAEDAAASALQVSVRSPGQAGLELVGPPSHEREMGVAVDEPGDDRAARPHGIRQSRRQALGRTRIDDHAVSPGEGAVADHLEGTQLSASQRWGPSPDRDQGRREQRAVGHVDRPFLRKRSLFADA
jgi:hypothetical protein